MPLAMTHAGQFRRSLEALNGFVFPRALLRYQQQVLDQGHFSLVCPWTGTVRIPTVCHISNNGDPAHGNIGIAYRVAGAQPLWLLAGSIKDGFPLTEAYLPTQNASVWSLGEAWQRENGPWRARLQALEARLDADSPPDVRPQAAVALLGHPNFAHHMWNELAAYVAYVDSRQGAMAGDTALRVKALYEPLIPVEAVSAHAAVNVTRIDSFDGLLGFQEVMVTRLGATQVPTALRRHLTRQLYERRDRARIDPLLGALRPCNPVIWLSLRLDARTLDNQQEFLWCLIHRIAAEYPCAAFILDGFSYPNDFDRALYRQAGKSGIGAFICRCLGRQQGFLSRAMTSREREISACARKLQAGLAKSLANPVVNVTGRNLADAAAVAGTADYYVCHAGTLQHKIAWLYNIPGMVHTNTTGLGEGVRQWLADQIEDGVEPGLVSRRYIKDLDSIRTANKVERNRDYHMLDVDSVIAEILCDLQSRAARSVAR